MAALLVGDRLLVGLRRCAAMSAFIGFTTKKKIAAAVATNVIAAVMNAP